jgi:hypothetical protein
MDRVEVRRDGLGNWRRALGLWTRVRSVNQEMSPMEDEFMPSIRHAGEALESPGSISSAPAIGDGESVSRTNLLELISLATHLQSQIDAQQTVRDRWFNHYLLICAGTLTAAISSLSLFKQQVAEAQLLQLAAVPVGIAGNLGILFLNIYLHQRRNYSNHYSALREVQERIFTAAMTNIYSSYYPQYIPFTNRVRGADYFTIWVIITLSSAYMALSVGLLALSLHASNFFAVALTLSTFLFTSAILDRYRKSFQRRNIT